jgi:hypothetical protein
MCSTLLRTAALLLALTLPVLAGDPLFAAAPLSAAAHLSAAAPAATVTPKATPPPQATATPAAATSGEGTGTDAPAPGDSARPSGWTDQSHGNHVDPNYAVVFPVDAVNTLTITLAPDDWAAMQEDMEDLYGPSLYIREAMLAAGPGLTAEERDKLVRELAASRPITETLGAAVNPDQGLQPFAHRSPMWVPATIRLGEKEWPHVGVRYKGASSLSPYLLGDMRLPFKFDFDQFEDDFPEIDNQRFFGFKQLTLANNYRDPSAMRDTVVYELLAEAGLPSLHTAPYEIVLDYGEGPQRLGLYTMVEVVDDTGVRTFFGSDDGNIYEGDGLGASLAAKNVELIEDSFEKKNNEDREDWSDIWALYDILHDPRRTTDPTAWRAELEGVFDVDVFLEWLGVAALVGHVDTYGFAPHNFYLYNDPAKGKLTWFSWDHNLTFDDNPRLHPSLDKANATDYWPLIRYLLDDPVYWDRYVALMAENFAGPLAPDAVTAKIRAHAELLAPYAARDMSAGEYAAAVATLVDFVDVRAAAVADFLAAEE